MEEYYKHKLLSQTNMTDYKALYEAQLEENKKLKEENNKLKEENNKLRDFAWCMFENFDCCPVTGDDKQEWEYYMNEHEW